MTRTFKISSTRKPKSRACGDRTYRKCDRRWISTPETYDPENPTAKLRTPMDIKGSKAPRDITKQRFFINVNHQSTRDAETEYLESLDDWLGYFFLDN
jgi:hypothetical protein